MRLRSQRRFCAYDYSMEQAARDVKRGLVDTDRGAEAGRTYKKLKQTTP